MRKFANILALSCLFSLLSLEVRSETLYVNNVTGSNSNSGLSSESLGDNVGPVRSIATALKLTQRGDTIDIANTKIPYEECITLQGRNNSGFEYIPFLINGNGATLDGTAEVPADEWDYVRGNLYRFKPHHSGHQFLFLDGKPAKQLPRFDGSYVSTFLQPLEWCRCRGGIHFMSEKGKSPYSYDLRYASHRVGITLYDVHSVVIRDLNIKGFQLDGVNAHDNAMECVLDGVVATANGRSGFSINGASRVTIANSEAHTNGEVDLRCSDWSTTKLVGTEFKAKERPVWTRHVNRRGQGARLLVDDVKQTLLQGWMLPEQPEQLLDSEEPPVPSLPEPSVLGPALNEPAFTEPEELPAIADEAPAPAGNPFSDEPAETELETAPLDEPGFGAEPEEAAEDPDLFEDVDDAGDAGMDDAGDVFDGGDDTGSDLFEDDGDLFGDFDEASDEI